MWMDPHHFDLPDPYRKITLFFWGIFFSGFGGDLDLGGGALFVLLNKERIKCFRLIEDFRRKLPFPFGECPPKHNSAPPAPLSFWLEPLTSNHCEGSCLYLRLL